MDRRRQLIKASGELPSLIDTVGVKNFVAECDRIAELYGERVTPPTLLVEMAAKGESFYKFGLTQNERTIATEALSHRDVSRIFVENLS